MGKPRYLKPMIRVSFRIQEEDFQTLQEMAKKRGICLSELIRRVLKDFIRGEYEKRRFGRYFVKW